MSSLVVPPGGFAGFAQMTPASQRALRGARTASNGARKRRRSKKAHAGAIRKAKGKRRAMKFGSPAWQKKYKVGKFRK